MKRYMFIIKFVGFLSVIIDFYIDCIKGWFRYGKYKCLYCRFLVLNNDIINIIGDKFRIDKYI